MPTPRRASWVVGVLCAATIALALGATALSERLRPRRAPPGDLFAPVHVTRIDVHQRLAPGTADVALDVADVEGLDVVVNLSGGAAGAGLEAQLAEARPGRVVVFMQLDPEGCCDDAWVAREASRLGRGKALGARGLAVGPEVARDGSGRGGTPGADGADREPLPLDSPRLQPIWDACAALELPVSVARLDAARPAAGPPPALQGAPSSPRVLHTILHVVERNPRVPFVVGARGEQEADAPATLARSMDRLPNLRIDLAGLLPALGRDPEASRALLLAHPDRVLFGSGAGYVTNGADRGIVLGAGTPILLDRLLGGRERRLFFESAYRFLETRDRDIPSPGAEGAPPIAGVGLPRRALEQIYHRNAERLLGLAAQEARR
jgi:predicted TIM-barrel fold metal-dependent hydrolase